MRTHVNQKITLKYPWQTLSTALLLFLLSGCQVNPVTGSTSAHVVTNEQAIQNAAIAYAAILSPYQSAGKVDNNHDAYVRVKTVFERLLPHAKKVSHDARDWSWEFHVISDPTVNAWCMAGGRIVFYTGIMDKLQLTDDELAFLMGHEMGHALAGHTAEKQSLQILTNIALLMYNNQHQSNLQLQQRIRDLSITLISLPYSRAEETEADKIGLELMTRAGYRPESSVDVWKKFITLLGPQTPEFQSDHPSHENRLVTLGQLIKSIKQTDSNQETLSSVAPIFNKFKAGEIVLDCDLLCSFANGSNRKSVMELYDSHRWQDLAIVISKVNFPRDLNYFYLGKAAEELGYKEAAVAYYKMAVELSSTSKRCDYVFKYQCNGIDVAEEAKKGLGRLQ